MAQINWTKQALADLEAIGDYIARDSPAIAQIFVDRIVNSIVRLESLPLSGRIVPESERESIREVIFRNYRIVYSLEDETIYILTIFHASKSLILLQ
ncbi:MAG: type II toxin-antitoxin system RelE/ParE family toxin [Pseudanabaena sp.]|nr:MAG: type II toxin-antitoxin system RelE/ParE family toxin [Pseudanabaena sp.]